MSILYILTCLYNWRCTPSNTLVLTFALIFLFPNQRSFQSLNDLYPFGTFHSSKMFLYTEEKLTILQSLCIKTLNSTLHNHNSSLAILIDRYVCFLFLFSSLPILFSSFSVVFLILVNYYFILTTIIQNFYASHIFIILNFQLLIFLNHII